MPGGGARLRALGAEVVSSSHTGRFCHRNVPTGADRCLVPLRFQARRFKWDLFGHPSLLALGCTAASSAFFEKQAPKRELNADG